MKHQVMWIESVKCLILLCVASSVKCSTNGINKSQYATMCVSSPLEYWSHSHNNNRWIILWLSFPLMRLQHNSIKIKQFIILRQRNFAISEISLHASHVPQSATKAFLHLIALIVALYIRCQGKEYVKGYALFSYLATLYIGPLRKILYLTESIL